MPGSLDSSEPLPISGRIGVKALLKLLRALLFKIHRLSIRKSRWFFVATLILSFLCLFRIPDIQTEFRIHEIVDPRFPSTEKLREMKRRYRESNSIFLIFRKKESGTHFKASEYCSVWEWLTRQRLVNPEIEAIRGIFDLRRLVFQDEALTYPPWTGILCDRPLPDESQVVNLRSVADSPWKGIYSDAAGKDFAVEVLFRDRIKEGQIQSFDPEPIGRFWRKLQDDFFATHPEIEALIGGRSIFSWHYKEAIKRDFWVNVFLLLFIIALLRIFYGTWRSGLAFLLITGLSVTLLLGAMAWTGTPIDLFFNGLFLLMVVASFEDFAFISNENYKNPIHWRRSFRAILLPGFFTSFTTVVGFASLLVSDLVMIRRFGLWSAIAVCIEYFVTFFVAPAALRFFEIRRSWTEPRRVVSKPWIDRLALFRAPKFLQIPALLLFAGALFFGFRLNFDESPRGTFDPDHLHHRFYQAVSESRGWEGAFFVEFQKGELEQPNHKVLEEIGRFPNVAQIFNPYSAMESMTQGLPPEWASAAQREVSNTPLYDQWFSQDGRARALVYIKNFDLKEAARTLQEIKRVCQGLGCEAVGEAAVYVEFSETVVKTLFKSLGVSFLIVAITVLFIAYARNIKNRLSLLFSILWSPVLMLGIIGFFQVQVNLITSFFASVLIGLAGDNAIQFLFGSNRGDLQAGIDARARASVHMSIVTALGSLFFTQMTVVPMRTMGWLFFGGFILAFIGDLWILRSLTAQSPKAGTQATSPPRTAG